MMNKIIFVGSLLLLTCTQENKISEPVIIKSEPKCTYDYFVNENGKRDSTIVECPDIRPPKGMQ